jgi:glycosyltransferase involved in cell wall biosynthesis
MQDNILVSIICNTYNHENYIADAIEGFLMQKTDFHYEILIHDDASTDKTADIIREYEKRHPDLIKPIYQTENQYSRGVKVGRLNRERAIGKYIAVCEGDDYWIDPQKLQKQVKYMESHPECSLCFHNAEVVDTIGKKTGKLHVPWSVHNSRYYYKKNTIYQAGELALLDFIPTASLFYPKHLMDNPPAWHMSAIVGDAALRLTLTSYGYAYYIDEVMSAYRTGVEGSATDRSNIENKDINKLIDRLRRHIELIDNFDEDTNYKFSNQLDEAKIVWEVRILEAQRKIKELNTPRYKNYYDELGKNSKIKLYARCYFPNIYKQLVNINSYLKSVRRYQ